MPGLISTTLVNVVTALLGLFSGIMLARILGPSERGDLAIIQNLPTMLLGFASLGLSIASGYFAGKNPKDARKYAGTAMIALMVWSVPFMAMLYWLIPTLYSGASENTIRIAQVYLLIIPIQQLISVPFWVLQGSGEFYSWNILRILPSAAWFGISCFSQTLSLISLITLYLILMMVIALIFLFVFNKKINKINFYFDLIAFKKIIRYGLPVAITSIPQQLNLRIDQLLIGIILPPNMLGIYVVAVSWGSILSLATNSISQVIFSKILKLKTSEENIKVITRSVRVTFLFSIFLTISLIFLTPFVFPVIFGNAYVVGIPIAILLLISNCISSINQLLGECLRGLGNTISPMFAEIIGLSVTTISLFFLLKKYSLLGVAITSILSCLVIIIVLIRIISKALIVKWQDILVPNRSDIAFIYDIVREIYLSKPLFKITRLFVRRK